MIRDAILSPCRRYRYTLGRRWGQREGGVTWIMLNPSTADAETDDPTIRRCMAFTQRFGFDAMVVVNLFAYRATDPREIVELGGGEESQGPENGMYVHQACRQGKLLIAAWGSLREPLRAAARIFSKLIRGEGFSLKCLGKTKNGQPRHPLYARADAPLIDWP